MKTKETFINKFGIFYTPDNAVEDNEIVTFGIFEEIVEDYYLDNLDAYIELGYTDVDILKLHVLDSLEWQFVETVLEEILNFN